MKKVLICDTQVAHGIYLKRKLKDEYEVILFRKDMIMNLEELTPLFFLSIIVINNTNDFNLIDRIKALSIKTIILIDFTRDNLKKIDKKTLSIDLSKSKREIIMQIDTVMNKNLYVN